MKNRLFLRNSLFLSFENSLFLKYSLFLEYSLFFKNSLFLEYSLSLKYDLFLEFVLKPTVGKFAIPNSYRFCRIMRASASNFFASVVAQQGVGMKKFERIYISLVTISPLTWMHDIPWPECFERETMYVCTTE